MTVNYKDRIEEYSLDAYDLWNRYYPNKTAKFNDVSYSKAPGNQYLYAVTDDQYLWKYSLSSGSGISYAVNITLKTIEAHPTQFKTISATYVFSLF